MFFNRRFKDSVFTALFNTPELLRELYCALEGVTLPPSVPVSINTLKNVLYMDKYNDISFEIGGKLIVLIEHQSTINPNMALRLLMYISDIYKTMVKGKSIYTSSPVSIPYPEFFVLYDGTEKFPDQQILHLSDLYEKAEDLNLPGKKNPLLELEVKVININEGRNTEIVKRCKKLSEYSLFIGKVQEYMKKYRKIKKALKEAVKYCYRHGILNEFLEIHGRRILGMLYTEWNLKDAKKVWREEARAEGLAEGLAEGRAEGLVAGRNEGLAEGREAGRNEGLAEGREAGLAAGRNAGHAEGQEKVLGLMAQGLSADEIRARLGR